MGFVQCQCVQLCSEKPREALVTGKLPLTDAEVIDFPPLLNLDTQTPTLCLFYPIQDLPRTLPQNKQGGKKGFLGAGQRSAHLKESTVAS